MLPWTYGMPIILSNVKGTIITIIFSHKGMVKLKTIEMVKSTFSDNNRIN
jgi:hypothetical protein